MRYFTGHTRSNVFRAVRLLALLILTLAIVSLLANPSPAQAAEGSIVAQESPYDPPEILGTSIEASEGPFARLSLWAQAALVSAVGVGAFFFVPTIARRIWGTFAGPDGDGS
jgi:hypothetical protein